MSRILLIVAAMIVLLTISGVAYVVPEWEQVIITQFGEPVGDPIVTPGLKFKLPFIQKVHRFDRRFLEWEGEVAELPTKDKVFILVDAYARWRISDALLFYQRNPGGEYGAQSRLDDILNSATRSAIAKDELVEVIRTSNRQASVDESYKDLESEMEPIDAGREVIRQEILETAKKLISEADLGIEILDVQFKRINYGQQVLNDVYNRMISERARISDRFRSEGQGQKAEILGNMERELQRIQSEAYREAQEIRGRADAEATDIYARVHNQSRESRQFYEFLKTMETLRSTADENTTLLLATDGEFYRFLEESGG
jgi:membrane protease subunit HflC